MRIEGVSFVVIGLIGLTVEIYLIDVGKAINQIVTICNYDCLMWTCGITSAIIFMGFIYRGLKDVNQ